ncbi:hypothetical protein XAC908_290018 [Xanthomonas citri pv. citri]|nr:hypothetical protein XAC908_290018 [Xanthomonas citri pv. citri]
MKPCNGCGLGVFQGRPNNTVRLDQLRRDEASLREVRDGNGSAFTHPHDDPSTTAERHWPETGTA